VALLEGKQMSKEYESNPEALTNDNFDKYYRPDLSDAFWVTSTLPDNVLLETFMR